MRKTHLMTWKLITGFELAVSGFSEPAASDMFSREWAGIIYLKLEEGEGASQLALLEATHQTTLGAVLRTKSREKGSVAGAQRETVPGRNLGLRWRWRIRPRRACDAAELRSWGDGSPCGLSGQRIGVCTAIWRKDCNWSQSRYR